MIRIVGNNNFDVKMPNICFFKLPLSGFAASHLVLVMRDQNEKCCVEQTE